MQRAHQAGGITLPAQVEKYRPKNIDDVVGNAEAVSRLQVIGREGNFPNVILAVCAAQAFSILIRLLPSRASM